MIQLHHHINDSVSDVENDSNRWLLLIHQIPPDPGYLRVKIGRRLARLGAVALKNSVYLLPRSTGALEDFQWLRREVVDCGGEATIVEAQFVDGLSNADIEALFRSARDSDYAQIATELRELRTIYKGKPSKTRRDELEVELTRLERRITDVNRIDFFSASGREVVSGLARALREKLTPESDQNDKVNTEAIENYNRRVWVTRTGIHVDRIASAWLIRNFIDEAATFKYVSPKGYVPEPGELRFDMFDAEFSHEGDLCTFEVLCERFALKVPGLRAIAELIHDIDIKDAKYARPETDGVAALIAGICLVNSTDDARLERGSQAFAELLAYFGRISEARNA
jgi:hypothetical protein